MTIEQRRRERPKGIIRWYEIAKESRVACVVWEEGNSVLIAEALEEMGLQADRLSLDTLEEGRESYDMVVAIDILEYAKEPAAMLRDIRSLLSPGGRLLLAADNRLGIRYFCGDQDFFTGKNYDGIENYRHLTRKEQETAKGRAYAKAEIGRFLDEAGFSERRFFSVFPRLSNPQILLAEDYQPKEALETRICPEYNHPDTVFMSEEELYPYLIENHLLHGMANGFFVECPLDGIFSPVNQVTLSGERGPEHAMATILRRDGIVKKCALYPEGRGKLQLLLDNNRYLEAHGVKMIEAKAEGEAVVMPCLSGVTATEYFRRLLMEDQEEFLEKLDAFWEIILHSSEHAGVEEVDWERFEPGWEERKKDDPNRDKWKRLASGTKEERESLGVILKRGYVDLVSLNCFYRPEGFVFYDQELYLENVPAKAILFRTIDFIYVFNTQLGERIPKAELWERYGLKEHERLFHLFIDKFLDILREEDRTSTYYTEGRREPLTVKENRRRLNYSAEGYAMIYKEVFSHIRGRKLYLFGAGRYAKRFRDKYGEIYPITGYLDNDESRQGTEVDGIPVFSPAVLHEMNPVEYKVLICIREYMPVVRQLLREKIANFSVYNPYQIYEDDGTLTAQQKVQGTKTAQGTEAAQRKKYDVGYVAGVFDLFHVGHLNLLRRAKEQCNYLIVGVVTDEGVILHKKSKPVIPFEERMEIVRACRYVDQAVEIPLNKGDTDEAYRRYKFDVQFSGSDYADDPKWKMKREFLQKHGADLVFFPYTEGVSTTQLKDVVIGEEEDS